MIYSLLVIVLGLGAVHSAGFYYHRGYNNEHRGAENCLPPIYHGLVITPFKRTYDDGDVIEIACKKGYEMKNESPNSTCRVFDAFGSYGVFMPAITPRTCKELPICRAPYGFGLIVTPMKPTYEVGENITLSCKEGFVQPDGPSTHTCEEMYRRYGGASFGVNGMHVCREIRDCPVPLQEGLTIKPLKMMYEPGDEISLSCDEGYELAVSETSTCEPTGHFSFERKDDQDYDIWQGHHYIFTTQACRKKAKCLPPRYPGLIVTPKKESYQSGDEIILSCEDDYELTSPNKSVCGYEEHGSWNMYDFFSYLGAMSGLGHFEPRVKSRTCKRKPRCYAPKERGVVITPEKRSYALGETVEVSCTEGYELVGESTRTCSRREKMHMFYHYIDSYGYSHAEFVPDMHYVCKKKEICRPPMSRGVVLEPKKSLYDIGDSVSVSCAPGYNLKRAKESTCQSTKGRRSRYGRFSPEIDGEVCEKIPSCDMPNRDGLIVSPKKDYYEIGDKVSLSCEEGYEQRVAPTSTCRRGWSRWSGHDGSFDPDIGRAPCRKAVSCQAPSGANLIVSPEKEAYKEGDEIELSCDEGYKRVAPRTMTCERSYYCRGRAGKDIGCFHPFAPRAPCIKKQKCRAPKAKHLIVSPQKETYEEGDKVTLTCEEKYEMKIPYDTLTCRTVRQVLAFNVGEIFVRFSPSLPRRVCKEKASCALPDIGEGFVISPAKDKYYVGDKIKISCEEGYELEGERMSECISKRRYPLRYFSVMLTVFKPDLEMTSCKNITTEEEAELPEEGVEPEKEAEPEVSGIEIQTPEPTDDSVGSGMEIDLSPNANSTDMYGAMEPYPTTSDGSYGSDSDEHGILEEETIDRA